MNNIKYANFKLLLDTDLKLINVYEYSRVFAGMYILTILVKDGFMGLKELQEEAEENFIDDIRREIKHALKRRAEKEN